MLTLTAVLKFFAALNTSSNHIQFFHFLPHTTLWRLPALLDAFCHAYRELLGPVLIIQANESLIQPRAHDATFATVVVGRKSVLFVVHEALLTHHSPFFRAMFNGGFEEASTKRTTLKEVRPSIFEFFVHWLHYQRLPDTEDDPQFFALWKSVDDAGLLLTHNLVYLNVFCEKYDVPALKRLTLGHLLHYLQDFSVGLPAHQTIMYAFKNLLDTSPLCRLLVDLSCRWADFDAWNGVGGGNWIATCSAFEKSTPLIYLRKVLQGYVQYAVGGRPSGKSLDVCDYHEHKDTEEKDACAAKRAA